MTGRACCRIGTTIFGERPPIKGSVVKDSPVEAVIEASAP